MPDSLRNIYKKSELARNLRDGIRELSLAQVTNRLRENQLSTRGLTDELYERLIRFEIRELELPEADVVWSDRDLDSDGPPRAPPRTNRAEIVTQAEVHQVNPAINIERASESEETDELSQTIVPREQASQAQSKLLRSVAGPSGVDLHSNASLASTSRVGLSGNARLVMSREVHMLHRQQENNGNTHEYHRVASASNVIVEDRNLFAQSRTSTEMRPIQRASRTDTGQAYPFWTELGFEIK